MFARVYDELMSDVDYEQLYTFIKTYLNDKKTIIDAGCGSGYLLCELLKKGHDAIGIDIDSSMLSLAYDRLVQNHLPIKLYEHDVRKPIGLKVDVILMMFDVINYFKGVKQVFKHVYESLNHEGIYLFDMYKEDVKETYDQYIEKEDEPFVYEWSISKTKQGIKHQFKYDMQEEIIYQYIYQLSYYLKLLDDIGFNYHIVSGPDERKHYIIAYKK